MNELDQHLQEIDRKKVINAIKLQLPIEMTSYTLSRNMEAYFKGVCDEFLEVCHQEHLKEYLNFCVSELLTNSKKANTKRVYFKEKGLDINNREDYEKGMETFKLDTFADIDHYLEEQKKAGLYVKLSLQILHDTIIIEVKNNSVLCEFEEERIKHKLETAQKYDKLEDVVTNVIDQSEGAGLGIIIIILMLQKVGLSKDNFKVFTTDTETITQIILPCDKRIAAGVEIVSYEYISLQNKIPVVRENFEKINEIISAEDIDRKKMLSIIRDDVTLSLLVLKYAIEKEKDCFSITHGLDLLSDIELKFIFSDSNPVCDLIDKTDEIENLWTHAKRTAFFAYNLYKNTEDTNIPNSQEYFYTAGLLNNFGRILIKTASDEQKQFINELSNQYEGLSEKILDVFRLGNASNYLTLVFLKKIGFNEEFSVMLSTWNTPELVLENEKVIVDVLYMAEMMSYYNEKMVDYYQLDKKVMKKFGITSENQLRTVIKQLCDAQ